MQYESTKSPLHYLKEASTPGISSYEFETFVVGKHHSNARFIQSLLRMKQESLEKLDYLTKEEKTNTLEFLDNQHLIKKIDNELSKHDINLLNDLDDEEEVYWIDRLARQSALEINTYGRIKPETIDKLMLMDEEHFILAMNKAGMLVDRIKNLAEDAHRISSPMPPTLPRT